MSEDDRTVWVGNLDSENITEGLLYELFLQAGPLHYVRIPKDKESGRLKNFGFVCYLHDVSVPYAIELFNGLSMWGRNLKVQSRNLQERQRQGLVLGPIGVHSLDMTSDETPSPVAPQHCVQQALMGASPNLLGSPGGMMMNNMMPMACQQSQYQQQSYHQSQYQQQSHRQSQYQQQSQQQSLMGAMPNILRHAGGQINNDVIAMARQQMALLTANQPNVLSSNPMLNTSKQPTFDRFGSMNYERHRRDNYNNNQRRHEDNRSRGHRSVDNSAMQDFKSHFDQDREDNSSMLADLQRSQGRFDYNRLGPRARDNDSGRKYDDGNRHNDNSSRYNDSGNRYNGNGSRYNDNGGRFNDSRREDNRQGGRYDTSTQNKQGRSRHDPYSRYNDSRR